MVVKGLMPSLVALIVEIKPHLRRSKQVQEKTHGSNGNLDRLQDEKRLTR